LWLARPIPYVFVTLFDGGPVTDVSRFMVRGKGRSRSFFSRLESWYLPCWYIWIFASCHNSCSVPAPSCLATLLANTECLPPQTIARLGFPSIKGSFFPTDAFYGRELATDLDFSSRHSEIHRHSRIDSVTTGSGLGYCDARRHWILSAISCSITCPPH
jgi:hypothetical protein